MFSPLRGGFLPAECPDEVLLTRKILPPCSMNGCDHAAGAVMDGVLYCGAHATEKLKSRMQAAGPATMRPART